MVREKTCSLELVASQEHVAPKRQFAATTGGFDIVCDQDGISIVGVSGYSIVVGATKASFDNRPAVMSSAAKE